MGCTDSKSKPAPQQSGKLSQAQPKPAINSIIKKPNEPEQLNHAGPSQLKSGGVYGSGGTVAYSTSIVGNAANAGNVAHVGNDISQIGNANAQPGNVGSQFGHTSGNRNLFEQPQPDALMQFPSVNNATHSILNPGNKIESDEKANAIKERTGTQGSAHFRQPSQINGKPSLIVPAAQGSDSNNKPTNAVAQVIDYQHSGNKLSSAEAPSSHLKEIMQDDIIKQSNQLNNSIMNNSNMNKSLKSPDLHLGNPLGSQVNKLMASGAAAASRPYDKVGESSPIQRNMAEQKQILNQDRQSPAREDFSWVKNICDQEYTEKERPLINIPKINVQIS